MTKLLEQLDQGQKRRRRRLAMGAMAGLASAFARPRTVPPLRPEDGVFRLFSTPGNFAARAPCNALVTVAAQQDMRLVPTTAPAELDNLKIARAALRRSLERTVHDEPHSNLERKALDAWTAQEPPPGFADRVLSAAEHPKLEPVLAVPELSRLGWRWSGVAAVAIVAALIGSVAAVMHGWPGSARQEQRVTPDGDIE